MSKFFLPPSSKKDQVQTALSNQWDAGQGEFQQKSLAWTTAHWYLQGLRRFSIVGTTLAYTAKPENTYIDEKGRRRIRVERALTQLRTEMGRILAIDMAPAVKRKTAMSLSGMRESAVAQAILDSLYGRLANEEFRLGLAYHLTAYGTVGIGIFDGPGNAGLFGGMEVTLIPAWELRGLPANIPTPDGVGGVTWSKWVPVDFLKKNFADTFTFDQDDPDCEAVDVAPGYSVRSEFSPGNTVETRISTAAFSTTGRVVTGDKEEDIKYVNLKQHWLYNESKMCTRWMIQIGKKLVLDYDYTDPKSKHFTLDLPVCPVHVARYMPVGSFWGRSFADMQLSLNRELEFLVGEMLQNMSEVDRLRILCIPTTYGINQRNLKQYLRDRFLPYSPTPGSTHRPEILSPGNIGDQYGRVINMVTTLMDQQAAQGELNYGGVPGRLESANSLAMVAQESRTPLAAVSESLAGCLSGFYKALLSIFATHIKDRPSDVSLGLSRIDETVLGVVLDPETGKIILAKNPVPSARDLEITIRSKMPRDPEVILQKMMKLVQMGIMSPVDFRIVAWKEGLDLPLLNKEEFYHYQSAWLQAIELYSDGLTPGDPTMNDVAENHVIYFKILKEVMASPAFRLASDPVQSRFVRLSEYHAGRMGELPQGAPALDGMGNLVPPNPQAMQAAGIPPSIGQGGLPDQAGMGMVQR